MVQLLHLVGIDLGHAHAEVDHELREQFAIDQDDFLLDARHVLAGLLAEL